MSLVYPTPRCMKEDHERCDTPQWCGCWCHQPELRPQGCGRTTEDPYGGPCAACWREVRP